MAYYLTTTSYNNLFVGEKINQRADRGPRDDDKQEKGS